MAKKHGQDARATSNIVTQLERKSDKSKYLPFVPARIGRYPLFSRQSKPGVGTSAVTKAAGLRATAVPGILMNMDPTTEDCRRSQDTARLTPRERLERFAALQRRAMQLLAASPEGYRRYWARKLRQRSIHAKY